jgi:polyisoprenoid-binding protein YceI
MRTPFLSLAFPGVLPGALLLAVGFGPGESSAPDAAMSMAGVAMLSPTLAAPTLAAPNLAAPTLAALTVTEADTVLFTVAQGAGNVARYRVREQLASLEFPNDAVGETSGVEGRLLVTGAGQILPQGSRFVIRLSELQSDSDRRDNYLRRNTLETETHPEAVFLPTAFRGLPSPLPTTGEARFQLEGQLTIRDHTFPVVWEVRAEFENGAVIGRAETVFTFEQARLQVPRVASVLSIREDIRLEYDFRLTPLAIGGGSR